MPSNLANNTSPRPGDYLRLHLPLLSSCQSCFQGLFHETQTSISWPQLALHLLLNSRKRGTSGDWSQLAL